MIITHGIKMKKLSLFALLIFMSSCSFQTSIHLDDLKSKTEETKDIENV